MALAQYNRWVSDGKPFVMCQPALDLRATLGRYGYSGPASGYPDLAHLQAPLAEDHCPYSQTPWPGPQPYPTCMAIDVMPDDAIDWVALGAKIVQDKLDGVPGTESIKYINWTDADGNCWHDEWQPNHQRWSSTDRGHIHLSWRTDYAESDVMAAYDPLGGDVALTPVQALIVWNTGWIQQRVAENVDPIVIPPHVATDDEPWTAPGATFPNKLAQAIAAVGGGTGGGSGVTREEVAQVVRTELDNTKLAEA